METTEITAEADQGHLHHEHYQHNQMLNYNRSANGTSEIVEEHSTEVLEMGSPMWAIVEDEMEGMSMSSPMWEGMSLFSLDIHKNSAWERGECVYVAVREKSETSMDALTWTLKNAVVNVSNTTVFLVHVFPEIRFVPSLLGNLPISRANEQQARMARAQERTKRYRQLQKYLDACISLKIRVDTILIESDKIAETILGLIPDLNITMLVVGTAKANLRRLKYKRGSGTINQILHKAPETCEVKIICEGKEVILEQMAMGSGSPSTSWHSKSITPLQGSPDWPKWMKEGSQHSKPITPLQGSPNGSITPTPLQGSPNGPITPLQGSPDGPKPMKGGSQRSKLITPLQGSPDGPKLMKERSQRSEPITPWQGSLDGPKPMKKGKPLVDYFSFFCFKPKAF
ncbi:hypothetical protein ACJRO7_022137 [Eucalyptus globulus]|uniref:UspA domain-containing protein n=1 Tax=Eucalyptus globulus TaxID=34317 RepID=A0ABD3KN34_EUCGL